MSDVLRAFIEAELEEGPRKKALAALALAAGIKAGGDLRKDWEDQPPPAKVAPVSEPERLQSVMEPMSVSTSTKTSTQAAPKQYTQKEIIRAMRRESRKHGLPLAFVDAIIKTESNYNQAAMSNKGAVGLMQLMPDTAKKLGVDPHDAIQNIQGGTRYLKQLHDMFDDWELTAAAYNAGPKNVRDWDGVPPFDETQRYVKSVMARTASSAYAQE